MTRAMWFVFSGLLLITAAVPAAWAADATPESLAKLPVPGMVTMIDLGAKKCIPCKMMAPIMEKMEKRYKGKAAIVFIDVWKHRDQAGGSAFGPSPRRSSTMPKARRSYAMWASCLKRIS